MKKLRLNLAVVALSLTALSGSAHAGGVQAGTLVCELQGKTNLILYSKRKFDCRFDPAGSRAIESYRGKLPISAQIWRSRKPSRSSGWWLRPPPTFRRELWREATLAAARRPPSAWASGREQ